MNTPKISLTGVTKSYAEHQVLKGITLDIAEGSVVTLIGPSGSGKSTLLRCVNLLEPIDDGTILLDGVDISIPGFDANPVRRRVGMVFQNFNLFPHMSVIDNITLSPIRTLGVDKALARAKAHDLLERFGLADKAKAYPDQLSGGQQQRVAIVRALAIEPEVLLLDEITSSLDPELVGEVLDVVCVLDEGLIIEQGPPAQVFSRPTSERAQQFLERVIRSGRL
jgi:polar amino acid transport system ATP-binding protein